MEIQEAYKQKMAAQLKEWGAQINLFEAKVENAGADMKVKRAEALYELRAKQSAASEKMRNWRRPVAKPGGRSRKLLTKSGRTSRLA